jgi:glutamate synthase domain-containing protein 2
MGRLLLRPYDRARLLNTTSRRASARAAMTARCDMDERRPRRTNAPSGQCRSPDLADAKALPTRPLHFLHGFRPIRLAVQDGGNDVKLALPAVEPRYWALLLVGVVFAFAFSATFWQPWFLGLALLSGFLLFVGFRDLTQTRQSIRRNYPILGHLRFWLEELRPEIRQYFLEDDTSEIPFSRNQRAIAYQRAKDVIDKRPFGTLVDVYGTGHEWLNHSIAPTHPDPKSFRIQIGGPDCAKRYDASVLNISAMSFGALSANAIRALNKGAKMGGFAHDTGEGSVSRYHREHGGDLIWELGTGYFGCRDEQGRFDPVRFADRAAEPQVKMIEIKLSQGAKPGHGGVLPGPKVSAEIAATRGVPQGIDCISPASHSAFSSPRELTAFIARLRDLSGGKPVGIKLCIGHPWEFLSMVRAMVSENIAPDFIVIDGAEGGTGAAPLEFTDHVGTPLREGLRFTHAALRGAGLRDRVRIGASGKIVTGFDIARAMALGADWCNSARGFMFALGCIQSQSCHTDRCPTGVATQDPARQRALVVEDKATRVANFHRNTLTALAEVIGAAGLSHPEELVADHLIRRISPTETKSAADLYPTCAPGTLLNSGRIDEPTIARWWDRVSADSFLPHTS